MLWFNFYPWFKFSFLLFQTNYRTLPYPNTKVKENKIKSKDKLNHKIYTKIDSSSVGVREVEFNSLSQALSA